MPSKPVILQESDDFPEQKIKLNGLRIAVFFDPIHVPLWNAVAFDPYGEVLLDACGNTTDGAMAALALELLRLYWGALNELE